MKTYKIMLLSVPEKENWEEESRGYLTRQDAVDEVNRMVLNYWRRIFKIVKVERKK